MNSSGEFAKILREVFTLDSQWVDWFMRDVFSEDELHITTVENRTAAIMLASPYVMDFHGLEVACDYISCVATLPQHRGKGLMRALMHETLLDSWNRNVPFATLIPASRPLYFIYDRLGFATVFYVDEERYTALHKFEKHGYQSVEPDYELFERLERQRECVVVHNKKRFEQAVVDMELSNGCVVAVSDGNGSEAIAFAEVDDEIKVLEILSTDQKAAEAALCEIRERGGEKAIIINALPKEDVQSLRTRGMIRIVNVCAALGALASANPKLSQTIRVSDTFIKENNGVYVLKSGKCEKVDMARHVDLEVSTNVLAKILFSSPKIGELFNLPTCRPFMSLMLD